MAARTDPSSRALTRAIAIAVVVSAAAPAAARADDEVDVHDTPVEAEPAVSDEDILGDPVGWGIEDFRFRMTFFEQDGRGFQSADRDRADGPGDEDAFVWQPQLQVRLRQSARVEHDIFMAMDVVSAASPDALDAVTTASRVNESGELDVTTRIAATAVDQVSLRWGFHVEEPLRSGRAGLAYRRSLAEDNAAITISGNYVFDFFDMLDTVGDDYGITQRHTVNGNLGFSQLLSPTTVFDASYGVTYQTGTLATTWNSTPIEMPMDPEEPVVGEVLPDQRIRHAFFGRIAQHVPATRTTLKLSYRYYFDDFDLRAHTTELRAYQYLVPWLYVRGSYRFHTQDGVEYFRTSVPNDIGEDEFRTSDSDLAPFDADEVGVKLVLVRERAPERWRDRDYVDASYVRYVRSNDFDMNVFSISYGRRF